MFIPSPKSPRDSSGSRTKTSACFMYSNDESSKNSLGPNSAIRIMPSRWKPILRKRDCGSVFGKVASFTLQTGGLRKRTLPMKDGHITTLSSRNGLPCDTVHWSMEDDDHAIWLYMSCGLVRVAKSELDTWAGNPTRVVQTTIFNAS